MHLGLIRHLLPSKFSDLSCTTQGELHCYYSGAYLSLCFGRLQWVMVVSECMCRSHCVLLQCMMCVWTMQCKVHVNDEWFILSNCDGWQCIDLYPVFQGGACVCSWVTVFAKLRAAERQQEYLVWSVHPEVFHLKEDKLNQSQREGRDRICQAPVSISVQCQAVGVVVWPFTHAGQPKKSITLTQTPPDGV